MTKKTRRPWIDISVPLGDAMAHRPNDPQVSIRRIQDIDQGYMANLSMISMFWAMKQSGRSRILV